MERTHCAKMAVCIKFRFIPPNTGCLSARVDKQIERKVLHVYMDLFFSNTALFETPRGDRIYFLCTVCRSRKGMPQAVKSTRLRNRGCGLIMQKGNLIALQ